MNVFYIRHNWKEPEWKNIIDKLYNNKEIGIHFEEIKQPNDPFDPERYSKKSGKTSIAYLNKCSEEECLIVASVTSIM